MCARDGFARWVHEEPGPLGLAPQPAGLPTTEHSGHFNGMRQIKQHNQLGNLAACEQIYSFAHKVSAGQMFAHVTHPVFALIGRGFEYSSGSENTQAYTVW